MSYENEIQARSGGTCELCGGSQDLQSYEPNAAPNIGADAVANLCITCRTQIDDAEQIDPNHWRCLNDSMWSEVTAVKVLAWRMLQQLKGEGWPQDLLDMMYLDEESQKWAHNLTLEQSSKVVHKDSNGNILEAGDTVTLIQDLNVKGGGFTAKRGTAVRRISLVADNAEHIEGKVDGQHIVILTKYVKKQSK